MIHRSYVPVFYAKLHSFSTSLRNSPHFPPFQEQILTHSSSFGTRLTHNTKEATMMSAYEKVLHIIHFPLLFWYQSYTVLYAFSRSSHCASRFGPSEVNSSQGTLKSLQRTSMKNF